MRKREAEELRRLEEALLESEYEVPEYDEEPDLPEFYRNRQPDMDIYNTDDVDLDIDAYSQQVYNAPGRGSVAAVLITILTSLLLSGVILLLLKYLGVL